MKKRWLVCIGLAWMVSTSSAQEENGLITVESQFDVATTAARLVSSLERAGLTVFARVDHAAGAKKVGKPLPPTELVIFGNPKAGTPLMHCQRTVAIDLPQKALIWEGDGGKSWVTYNDPSYLHKRHGLTGCEAVVEKVGKVLRKFIGGATKGP